jgi:predicted O-methyltransferase YrrM
MSDLEARRLEITNGFAMPGFKGRYFMWPEEYWLLSKYLDMTRGDYLEIGSMCGIIAMSFAEKNPNRQFVCVDKFCEGHATIAGERETFFQNLKEHRLNNVTLLEGNSLEVVPKISQRFEIAFVDANHAYDYVLADANNSWRLLLPGGFIAFHDYGYVEDTTRAVDEFLKQTGGRFLESTSSLAVVQKQAAPIRAGLHRYMSSQNDELRRENATLSENLDKLQSDLDKLQSDLDWLLSSIKSHEESLADAKRQLEVANRQLEAVLNSAGWRMLNKWRQLRNWLAPDKTWHRRLYDSILRTFRGSN